MIYRGIAEGGRQRHPFILQRALASRPVSYAGDEGSIPSAASISSLRRPDKPTVRLISARGGWTPFRPSSLVEKYSIVTRESRVQFPAWQPWIDSPVAGHRIETPTTKVRFLLDPPIRRMNNQRSVGSHCGSRIQPPDQASAKVFMLHKQMDERPDFQSGKEGSIPSWSTTQPERYVRFVANTTLSDVVCGDVAYRPDSLYASSLV